jgi:hypothetical protein
MLLATNVATAPGTPRFRLRHLGFRRSAQRGMRPRRRSVTRRSRLRPPRLRSKDPGPRHSESPRWRVHGRRAKGWASRRTRCIRARPRRRYSRFPIRIWDRNETPCLPCSNSNSSPALCRRLPLPPPTSQWAAATATGCAAATTGTPGVTGADAGAVAGAAGAGNRGGRCGRGRSGRNRGQGDRCRRVVVVPSAAFLWSPWASSGPEVGLRTAPTKRHGGESHDGRDSQGRGHARSGEKDTSMVCPEVMCVRSSG